jgi:hypothetical protein
MLALNVPDLFSYRSCNFKVRLAAAAHAYAVSPHGLTTVDASHGFA